MILLSWLNTGSAAASNVLGIVGQLVALIVPFL